MSESCVTPAVFLQNVSKMLTELAKVPQRQGFLSLSFVQHSNDLLHLAENWYGSSGKSVSLLAMIRACSWR